VTKPSESTYLTGAAPTPTLVVPTGAKDEVAQDVAASGLADFCPEYADLIARRSICEGEYPSPLPIDPKASEADRRIIADLETNDQRAKAAARRLDAATTVRDEQAASLLALPAPCSRASVAAFLILSIFLAAGVAICGGIILAPTLEPALNAFYASRTGEPDPYSLLAAHLAAGGLFFLLCLSHLAVVVGKRGSPGVFAGLLAAVVDVGFAAAWGLQRLPEGTDTESSWHLAASITLLEVVAALLFALSLVGLAALLRRNADKSDAVRAAKTACDLADELHARAAREQAEAEKTRRALLEHVATREASARRAEDRRALLDVTARLSYATEVAGLARAEAENPSADQFTSELDRHVADRSKTGRSAPQKGFKWPWQKS
jgi:Tfp pilus assembly protein PilV